MKIIYGCFFGLRCCIHVRLRRGVILADIRVRFFVDARHHWRPALFMAVFVEIHCHCRIMFFTNEARGVQGIMYINFGSRVKLSF